MNEIGKASKEVGVSDPKITSHASKYEIPDLDRTLSNDAIASKPVEQVPVSPIPAGRFTSANIAETSRFGGALQNSNSHSKNSLNFANETSKYKSTAFEPKDQEVSLRVDDIIIEETVERENPGQHNANASRPRSGISDNKSNEVNEVLDRSRLSQNDAASQFAA